MTAHLAIVAGDALVTVLVSNISEVQLKRKTSVLVIFIIYDGMHCPIMN